MKNIYVVIFQNTTLDEPRQFFNIITLLIPKNSVARISSLSPTRTWLNR